MSQPQGTSVGGWTAPGFEEVAERLGATAAEVAPGGAAFAAAVHGELVVDIWAGDARPGEPWGPETTSVLFSATKGLTTLVAQVLAERGELDIDAPIAEVWPEFAAAGKAEVTMRHVLTHTSGVVYIDPYEDLLQPDGTGYDQYEELARRLAAVAPAWPPGTRHGYHANTFGWLIGEVVRRTTGRSLGTYFRQEIAVPLGLDLFIGTPASQLARKAEISAAPATIPDAPGMAEVFAWFRDPTTMGGKAFLARSDTNAFDRVGVLMNSPKMLQAEQGAGNATGTARSLARMYGIHARGGELDGVRLLTPDTVREWGTEQVSGVDELIRLPWRWALGYHLQPEHHSQGGRLPFPLGPNADAFGHGGFGGQVGGVDPERGLSIGFLRSRLGTNTAVGARLTEAVVDRLS